MAQRRTLAVLAAVIAAFGLALVAIRGFVPQPNPVKATSVLRAQAAAKAMLAWYYLPDRGLLTSYAPSGTSQFARIWGYSWALKALEDVAALPGGRRFMPVVRRLADDLDRYWDTEAGLPAYAPTVDPGPAAVKYYDDNAWVGLDLVEAFDLTADERYLREAEAVFRYEETGWDNRLGGIYWNDDRDTRNTVSNAPVAELAARLYLATGRSTYLAWAKKIYHWQVRTLVDPRTGQVWGNIDGTGAISHSDWTYNQGTVIGAAVLLYRITHQASYLRQARKTAGFVLRKLVRADGAIEPPAEFGGVLVDNLLLLYDETGDPAIARVISSSAASAWTDARNGNGLVANDWQGPPPKTAGHPLLTQSGAVRLLAVDAAIKTHAPAPWAGYGRLPGP